MKYEDMVNKYRQRSQSTLTDSITTALSHMDEVGVSLGLMEDSGLIDRHVESTVPPAVEYSLTPLGRRFVDLVETVYAWGRANADALDQLQARATSRRNR